MVRVANSYSATLNPALLWAVILSTYQVAGSRSKIKIEVVHIKKYLLCVDYGADYYKYMYVNSSYQVQQSFHQV